MSNFFSKFPVTRYLFGDETRPAITRNISIYADTIDQVRDAYGTYEDYYIQPGERPDQISQKLYGTPEYHWTFILMNPKLRELGWPISQEKLYTKAQKDFYHKVITTKTSLSDKFKIGQTVTGLISGATGKIGYRILDNGQIWFDDVNGSFIDGETATSAYQPDANTAPIIQSIVIDSYEDQYNAAHHYEDANENWVDIDPTVGPGAQITKITFLDYLIEANNNLKQIRVIKPRQIERIVESFYEALE